MSRKGGRAQNSSRLSSPAPWSTTRESSASSSVNTSEKPNRPYTLPPTVAQLRNCTPTMCSTLRAKAPRVMALSPSWVSRARRGTMAPSSKARSVSVIRSSPRPHRSMAVPTFRSCIFSQSIPPSTT